MEAEIYCLLGRQGLIIPLKKKMLREGLRVLGNKLGESSSLKHCLAAMVISGAVG